MIKTVFEKGIRIGRAALLLGMIRRRVRKGHPGPAPTATRGSPRGMPIGGDLRRSTRMMPGLRRLILLSVLSVLASLAVTASASAGTLFTNSTPIEIPSSGSSGPATPYPSQITVSGMSGPITDVNVTLHRVGHTFTSDIAVLLVSPSGDTVKLMQTNCGGLEIEDFTWIFDQQAATPMPPPGSDGCAGFVYRPNPSSFAFSWPAPAPPGPHGVSLSDFNNEQANGTWSLYVADTQSDDVGDIEGGWSLSIETGPVDVAIPGTGTSGPANPYPATLSVSGSGGITDLDVIIDGIWHERPEDLDMLLVGPHGQKVILMSDACGSFGVSAYGWVWDDEAAALMPGGDGTDVCGTRFHRPTDYLHGESWPAPAPAGPYSNSLSAFDFTNPNGEWRLFVNDDADGGTGFFTNRFQLQITTDSTAPTVTSVSPANKATGIGRGTNVKATFSEVMSDPSINSNTFKLFKAGTTTAVGASVTYDTPTEATLNPNNNLRPGTKYKAVVTTGARDLAGNRLDQKPGVSGNQQKVWFFTTRR
jgi:subtilisin-like proprotein convertase family protein